MFRIFVTTLLIAICLIVLSGTKACAQTIYVVSSPEQYLQMTLLADDDAYVLYDLETTDERLTHFCGQVCPQGEAEIVIVTDKLFRKKLERLTPAIVVFVDSPELSLGLIGAEIARQLGGFVCFSKEEVQEINLMDVPLIQIGGLKETNALYFENLSEACAYYKSIRINSDVLVSTDGGEYGLAAFRLAKERDGMLIFRGLESVPIRERGSVLWIAEPKDLAREDILDIYGDLDYFGARENGYSIGFFTGFSATDLSLMVERNLYLARNQSIGAKILVVSEGSTTKLEKRSFEENSQSVHILGGSQASWPNFSRLLPSADLVQLSAHGSPYGFRLYDRFVTGNLLPLLRPGIVNISGCYAAAGIENTEEGNILLSFLRQGAAICIGSTGMGFSSLNHLSSPSVSLGEQVRLLNYYVWKNTGSQERAVLLGDPTLALAQDPYQLLGDNQVRFSMPEAYSHLFAEERTPIFLHLPHMPMVRSAIVTGGDGGRENLDDGLFGYLLSLQSRGGSFVFLQTKFAQGVITFSSSPSPSFYFNSAFRFTVVALKTFLRDYLLNRGMFVLLLAVAAVFFVLLFITKTQIAPWRTLFSFGIYAMLYLGSSLAMKNRFDLGIFLVFFLLSYFPTLLPNRAWKKVGLYLLGIGLPSLLVLPELLLQSQGLLHFLIIVVGFLLSGLFPISLIWVNGVLPTQTSKMPKRTKI